MTLGRPNVEIPNLTLSYYRNIEFVIYCNCLVFFSRGLQFGLIKRRLTYLLLGHEKAKLS